MVHLCQFNHGVTWNVEFLKRRYLFRQKPERNVWRAGLYKGGNTRVSQPKLMLVKADLLGVFELFPCIV